MSAFVPQLIFALGGPTNILAVYSCATRLRVRLRDPGLQRDSEIEALPEVLLLLKRGDETHLVLATDLLETVDALTVFLEEDAT